MNSPHLVDFVTVQVGSRFSLNGKDYFVLNRKIPAIDPFKMRVWYGWVENLIVDRKKQVFVK